MAKNQSEQFQVSYVVAVKRETIQNMFTKQFKTIMEPIGEQHIFEVEMDGEGNETLRARSFCKKERSKIAEETGVYKTRQPGPVCQACQEAWKKDPRSPWRAWAAGKPVGKVKE